MYKKIYFLFVVLSLASCVPISDTKKSKLKFKPKAKTESIKEDETNNTETTSQGQLPSIIKLTQLEYQSAVKKILDANCLSCHGDGKSFQEFANLAPSISEIEKDIKLVIPRDLNKSVLYQKVAFGSMKAYLGDSKDADIFKDWILSISSKSTESLDTTAPIIKSFLPNGSTYEAGVESVMLTLVTDEDATCSFSSIKANLDFSKMTKFSTTGVKAHAYTAMNLNSGNYSYFVKCMDTAKNISLEKEIKFNIKAAFAEAPLPADTIAPLISSFLPNGATYESNTTSVDLSAVTDEAATCSFSIGVAKLDFSKMIKFTTTGVKAHTHKVSNLKDGIFSYFIKCMDSSSNVSLEKEIKFSIKAMEIPAVVLSPAELKVAVRKIFDNNCLSCHGSGKSSQKIANLAPDISVIEKNTALITPKDLTRSKLYQKVTTGTMKVYLTDLKDKEIIKEWILSIAPEELDTTAPLILSFLPNGTTYESNITGVDLSATTDEAAICSFSIDVAKLDFSKMTKFSTTGAKAHSHAAMNLKPGNYSYFIKCMDSSSNVSLEKEIKFSIKAAVVEAPLPTDTTAPLISSFLPNGATYESNITGVDLSATTDEAASCGFSMGVAKLDFSKMTKFSTTGTKKHLHAVMNLKSGNYSYFIKCIDSSSNISLEKEITFSIKAVPVVVLTPAELRVAVKKIFDNNCLVCHGAGKPYQNIANLAPDISVIENNPIFIIPKDLAKSYLYQQVTKGSMKAYLPDSKDADIIKDWILSIVPAVLDTKAPLITSSSPANGSSFDSGVTSVKLAIVTDESTSCASSTSKNLDFSQMTKFATTGDKTHTHDLTNLQAGDSSYFIKCMDLAKNISLEKNILFTIKGVVLPIPDPVVTQPVGFTDYVNEAQMASRSYIESVLLQVFDATGTTAATYINTDIYQSSAFGGPCDYYSAGEIGNPNSSKVQFEKEKCFDGLRTVLPPTNNPMRYSITTKVCEKLVSDTDRLNAVKKKIFSDLKWGNPTDEKIKLAWDLFHQVSDIDADITSGLKDIGKVTANNDEAWKIIILTLCMSPEWQVL